MNLEDLVPELLARILQLLNHPRDLLQLLRASPQCFRVYAQSPAPFLSSVLKNAILPHALRHALACEGVPSDASQTVREAFLDDYFRPKSLAFPTDKSAITALAGLFLRASYFVDDYSSRAMRALNLDPDATASALSPTERAKLQRAFFRYELYCRVFPVDYHAERFSIVPAEEQFTQFLARMSPWEVEEMTCVHHYFTALFGGYIDDLEDQLVEAVLTCPGVCPPSALAGSPSSETAKRRKIRVTTASGPVDWYVWSSEPAQTERDDEQSPVDDTDNTDMVTLENFDLHDLDLFTKQGRFRSLTFVSYLASLGSAFVYRLILADKDQRRRIIQENTPVCRDFLPEALEHALSVSSETPMAYGFDNGLLSFPTMGYSCFKRSNGDIYLGFLNGGLRSYPLRERAYVFWDPDRILSIAVGDQLEEAASMDWETVNMQFNRYKGKSAEERLKGVKIPRVQRDRIIEEFGSVFDQW
ncbi:hypothetical protein ACQKWADRAFT_285938 [Trichoderma austrokoningii]